RAARHRRRVPEPGRRVSQRLLLLAGEALRPGPLSPGRGAGRGRLRSAGRGEALLRDPRPHAGHDPRPRLAVLREDRCRGPLSAGAPARRPPRAAGLARRGDRPRAPDRAARRAHLAGGFPGGRRRAMSFRVKLALAMLLAVAAVAGVTLVVIGRSVEGTYRQMFEERFESDVSLLAALQGARLGAVKSRCLGLARSVRLIAAMEEEDAALLHRIALDELRDVLAPAPWRPGPGLPGGRLRRGRQRRAAADPERHLARGAALLAHHPGAGAAAPGGRARAGGGARRAGRGDRRRPAPRVPARARHALGV